MKTTTSGRWRQRQRRRRIPDPAPRTLLYELRTPNPTSRILTRGPRTIPRGSRRLLPADPVTHSLWRHFLWRHPSSIRRDGSLNYRFVYPWVRIGIVYLLTELTESGGNSGGSGSRLSRILWYHANISMDIITLSRRTPSPVMLYVIVHISHRRTYLLHIFLGVPKLESA